ncbi:hypothetical protein LguiB_009072 [Lonicera macranthoides]
MPQGRLCLKFSIHGLLPYNKVESFSKPDASTLFTSCAARLPLHDPHFLCRWSPPPRSTIATCLHLQDRRSILCLSSALNGNIINHHKILHCSVSLTSHYQEIEPLTGNAFESRSYVKEGLILGQLHGNRFTITLRGVVADSEDIIKSSADALGRHGFINYFGLKSHCDPLWIVLCLDKLSSDSTYSGSKIHASLIYREEAKAERGTSRFPTDNNLNGTHILDILFIDFGNRSITKNPALMCAKNSWCKDFVVEVHGIVVKG